MKRRDDGLDSAGVRNLDEIQEADPSARPSRVGALVLASLGGACIVFAAVALMRSPPKARPTSVDPLGDLVAKTHPAGSKPKARDDGIGNSVTFPGILSDAKSPTTALEAVRSPQPPGAVDPSATPPGFAAAADRLPIVPLPAQHVLQASPAETAPQDTLTTMARQVSREGGEESAAGGPGAYQLQVSSFKTEKEASSFASALRRRGHKAYVEPANVKGRGLWYRVRIGPFKYRHSAVLYRQEFEAKERMVTFIVDPPKTNVHVGTADSE